MIQRLILAAVSAVASITAVCGAEVEPCQPAWSPLDDGVAVGVSGGSTPRVLTLLAHNGSSESRLYVGGQFASAGGIDAAKVAAWTGAGWSALAGGVDESISDLVLASVSLRDTIIFGGFFHKVDDKAFWNIARWQGGGWSGMGPVCPRTHFDGIDSSCGMLGAVACLTTWDDGSGTKIVAGGEFTDAAGASSPRAVRIAIFDNGLWSAIGNGIGMDAAVRSLGVFDDGTGSALYAGGQFASVDGLQIRGIARWSGNAWEGVGSADDIGSTYALKTYDDGLGPALYAAGTFQSIGGVLANGIAKWDGATWSALTGPSGTGVNGTVWALTVFDDGTGPALYVGGTFTTAGGVQVNYIAKWDGTDWSPLNGPGGIGVNSEVSALTVFDDGTGPALYAGGSFTTAGGMPVNRIAKWRGCASTPTPCPGDADNDGAVDFDDITSVLANWSANYTPGTGPGDANNDGVVDFNDITAVLANWGVTCP